MGKTIAIDGPSGAGKSTVAKKVAEALGFRYLDTGALYRAVALGLRRKGIHTDASDEELRRAVESLSVEFKDEEVYLNGENVSAEIRTPKIGHLSSVFSARRPVRDYLLPVQQGAGRHHDLVAEGRDMTTVVFPRAWGKFYLDADVESRAMRRFLQLEGEGVPISMERAREDVVSRDERDSRRDISPLRVAEDAVFLDTSRMSVEEVIERVLAEARGKG
jgi:cytidylate kinase